MLINDVTITALDAHLLIKKTYFDQWVCKLLHLTVQMGRNSKGEMVGVEGRDSYKQEINGSIDQLLLTLQELSAVFDTKSQIGDGK